MASMFETERTFFHRSRSELLREVLGEVTGAIRENVPKMRRLPYEVEGHTLTKYMLEDEFQLRQMAERLLRHRFRLPEDIPEDQRVDQPAREDLEKLLEDLNHHAAQVARGQLVNSMGKQIHPRFISLFSPSGDNVGTVNLTLNSFNFLPGWKKVFSIRAFLDGDGYRAGQYVGQDMFIPFRNPDSSIASYLLVYKGDHHPNTPWYCLTRDDYPLLQSLVNKALSAFARYQRGEMNLDLH